MFEIDLNYDRISENRFMDKENLESLKRLQRDIRDDLYIAYSKVSDLERDEALVNLLIDWYNPILEEMIIDDLDEDLQTDEDTQASEEYRYMIICDLSRFYSCYVGEQKIGDTILEDPYNNNHICNAIAKEVLKFAEDYRGSQLVFDPEYSCTYIYCDNKEYLQRIITDIIYSKIIHPNIIRINDFIGGPVYSDDICLRNMQGDILYPK